VFSEAKLELDLQGGLLVRFIWVSLGAGLLRRGEEKERMLGFEVWSPRVKSNCGDPLDATRPLGVRQSVLVASCLLVVGQRVVKCERMGILVLLRSSSQAERSMSPGRKTKFKFLEQRTFLLIGEREFSMNC
jgi:hypothetical protein